MIKCPNCGSTAMVKDGKTKIGTQRYKCKLCGKRSCNEKSRIVDKDKKQCKYCGSFNTRKKGFTKANTQIYYCNECNKKFTFIEIGTFTKEEKLFIIRYYFGLKVSAIAIAKHIGKTKDQVYYFLKEYKKKRGIT